MTAGAPAEPEQPALTRLLRLLAVVCAIGASIALAVWALSSRAALLDYVAINRLDPRSRNVLLVSMAAGGVFALVAGIILARFRGLSQTEQLAARLRPLILVGFVPFLLAYPIWIGRDLAFLVLVTACCLLFQGLFQRALEAGALAWLPRVGKVLRRIQPLPLGIAVAVAVAYAAYFSKLTITSHYNFCTSAFDLGIEDSLLWNAAHGEALFRTTPLGDTMRHGAFHQTYFSYALAVVYRAFPRAETLLVIQSAFIGGAAIPLYFVAERRVGSLSAALLCVLYALYAPLHGANLYDFHYQPLAGFFLFLLVLLLDRQKNWAAAVTVLFLLSVREDMGVFLVALGAYLALSGSHPKTGLVLAGVGATHFVALKFVIMPVFFAAGTSSYTNIYTALIPHGETGFGGVLKTLIGNPGYVLGTVLTGDKLVYALQILAPVALLPLRGSMTLVLLVPGVLFTLLSTAYPAAIMTSFQYTAYWTPMIFLSVVLSLQAVGRAEERGALGAGSKHAWLVALSLAMLFTSIRYGSVFQTETARGAFDAVRLTSTREDHRNNADFEAVTGELPASAKVVAAEWLVSHVSNRRDAYTLRLGVVDAEYLLFWLHSVKLRYDERPILRALLSEQGGFGVVVRRGLFVLARRGHDTRLNASVLREL